MLKPYTIAEPAPVQITTNIIGRAPLAEYTEVRELS